MQDTGIVDILGTVQKPSYKNDQGPQRGFK
jgi:hypothetical protein